MPTRATAAVASEYVKARALLDEVASRTVGLASDFRFRWLSTRCSPSILFEMAGSHRWASGAPNRF